MGERRFGGSTRPERRRVLAFMEQIDSHPIPCSKAWYSAQGLRRPCSQTNCRCLRMCSSLGRMHHKSLLVRLQSRTSLSESRTQCGRMAACFAPRRPYSTESQRRASVHSDWRVVSSKGTREAAPSLKRNRWLLWPAPFCAPLLLARKAAAHTSATISRCMMT